MAIICCNSIYYSFFIKYMYIEVYAIQFYVKIDYEQSKTKNTLKNIFLKKI